MTLKAVRRIFSHRWLLIGVLCLAAVLRLWNLGIGDPLNDEALIAFRAIGPMDFDLAEFQTTPLEWFDELNGTKTKTGIPWWTSLSFHDHPPLVFWAQHVSMQLFGENVIAFRFPSALLGIASIYLLYRIVSVLGSKREGLLAALLFSVTVSHVHISRLGMQEAYVIFFMLLTSYWFLRGIYERERYFLYAGVGFGLALLTKYTVFVLVPWLGLYLIITKPRIFKRWKMWIGVLIALIVFSPVILYNIMLYRTVGHFDFQFSALFGQNPDVWQVAPGKQIGTVGERISHFVPWLINSNSLLFLTLAGVGLFWYVVRFVRRRRKLSELERFTLVGAVALTFFVVFVTGPAYRFLSMLTPIFAIEAMLLLLAVYAFVRTRFKKTIAFRFAVAILAVFSFFEISYAANIELFGTLRGAAPWFSSKLREENYSLGYNELEQYLSHEFDKKFPAIVFNKKYAFLKDLQQAGLRDAKRKKYKSYPALIIYDHNIFNFAQLWSYDRRFMYYGWPFMPTEQYYRLIEQYGNDYLAKSGFRVYYFISPTEQLKLRRMTPITTRGPEFEQELVGRGIKPIEITNVRGKIVFQIYKFER